MKFCVNSLYENAVLRDFLYKECKLSRKTLCKLKKNENGILLNGIRVTVRATLHRGDEISLAVEDDECDVNPYVLPAGNVPDVLYEDEAVIVVNKPSGMPTHTSFSHYADSLSNAVLLYFRNKGLPFVFRAVNRLDRDTSGAVVIAKNRYYAGVLSKSMQNGEFEKNYLAVTDGIPPKAGKIEGYIAREAESIIKRKFSFAPFENADYSLTEYRVFSDNSVCAVVLLRPVTGRTHQLRVQLSAIGCPITGDTMYGSESVLINRQALHAVSVSFITPSTGKPVTVKAPVPDDINNLAEYLGLGIPESCRLLSEN